MKDRTNNPGSRSTSGSQSSPSESSSRKQASSGSSLAGSSKSSQSTAGRNQGQDCAPGQTKSAPSTRSDDDEEE